MNWEAIGAVGEILGALGVIATLVYLAIQVRQNTEGLRVTAFTQGMEQAWHGFLAPASDEQLAEIMVRGYDDPESLSPVERQRFGAVLACVNWGLVFTYHFYERGLVSEELLQTVLENSAASGFYSTPGFVQGLERGVGPVSVRFRKHLHDRYGVPLSSEEAST